MGDVPLLLPKLAKVWYTVHTMENTKRCTKCDQEKSLSGFYRNDRCRSGFEGQCKECKAKTTKKRRNDPASAPRARARLWREANPGMKRCSKCKKVLPVSEFYRCSKNSDGLKFQCKTCRAEAAKVYRPAYIRAYYAKHKEQYKAQAALYYQEHGEEIRARVREYQHANPEENRRRSAQWQKDNRSRCNDHSRVRSAKKRSNGGSFTVDEWLALCEAYDFRCACCGCEEQTVDHVIPVSKGGSSNISNIQPLCKVCNSSKHTKTTDYRV